MPRYAKIILIIILSFALLIAIAITVAATFKGNYAKPWVEKELSALTHRSVKIEGDLIINWRRPMDRSGWKGWLPWPEITARDIRVGQPEWTPADTDMGRAQELRLLIDPAALFSNVIRVASLELKNADLDLILTETGSSNWTLNEKPAPDSAESKWQFVLLRLGMENVNVRLQDPSLALDVQATLDSLEPAGDQGYALGWQAKGQYHEGTISGSGKAGGLLALQQDTPDAEQPFPIQADLKVGDTTIQVEGTLVRPTQLSRVDLQLELKGASMADLNELFGVALPNTPEFHTKGRLLGDLAPNDTVWHYKDFTGTVGSSDLNGEVQYQVREPRGFLTGDVHSKLLRLQDLGPVVGVDGRKKAKGKAPKQPSDKAIPVATINTDSWGYMDADVKFKGEKILRPDELPLDKIEAHIKLDNKLLSLTPLNFGMAGGTLRTEIELNGRQEQIEARLKASAKALQLRQLLRVAESMRASLGTVHANASLSSRGSSFSELLGNSNGEVKAVVTRGTVSHFLLEAAGLNIADMVIVKMFGDEQIMLNCLAADFIIKDGMMHTRAFKLDTKDAKIDITGNINLATEKLDLDIDPENKSLRIFTLRTPLYVRGSFKNPDVGVHEGPIAARAGAAVALGVIATPLAAIIPLLNLGADDTNECAPLLKATTGGTNAPKPKAPKPAAR